MNPTTIIYGTTTLHDIHHYLLNKFKWTVRVETIKKKLSLKLFNRKQNHAATLSVEKGRYRIHNSSGHLLLSGNNEILGGLDEVLIKHFMCDVFAAEVQQSI